MEIKLESNINYKKVYVTIQLSPKFNKLLSESANRSKRKKNQEATSRMEHHLTHFVSIAEYDRAIQLTEDVE